MTDATSVDKMVFTLAELKSGKHFILTYQWSNTFRKGISISNFYSQLQGKVSYDNPTQTKT